MSIHYDLRHFPVADLTWLRDDGFLAGSQVLLLNSAAADTAIVCVHGWRGSALGTWEEFPSAIRSVPEAARTDAFFLNYPSTTLSVSTCAREAQEFLHDVLRDPANTIVNPSMPSGGPRRPPGWRYRRVVVMAHSMGAVVSRRALLDLERGGLSPAEAAAIRLLFFAPAHLGSSLPEFIASGLGLDWLPGPSLVGRALKVHYRSLADLEEGSKALDLLLDDNRSKRERRNTSQEPDDHLRAFVLHAWKDKVVVQDRFDEDHDGRPVPDRHHRSVCKPAGPYRRPIDGLRQLL